MTAYRPPIPPDEARRLRRLRELLILDTAPEALFDRLAKLASETCGTPIALVSLVDEERQWWKAKVGLPGLAQTGRDAAFCADAITRPETTIVTDATADPRFAGNPLVTGPPDIRFYAGAPLTLRDGTRIGTLCVIDRQPRQLTAAQTAMLESLAGVASAALEMRSELIQRAIQARSEQGRALLASESRYRAIVEQQSELVSLARAGGELLYVNPAYAAHFGHPPAAMVGANLFDFVEPEDREAVRAIVSRVMITGSEHTGENRSLQPDGRERWVAWTNTSQTDASGQPVLHSVGRDVTGERVAQRALARRNAMLQSIIDVMPGIVAVVDTDLRYCFVNHSFARWVGRPQAEVVDHSVAEVLGDSEFERTRPWIQRVMDGEAVDFDKEFPDRPGAPHLSISLIPLRVEDDRIDGFVTIAQDITRHRREAERLLDMAQRDALTGLLNRAGFEAHLDRLVQSGLAARLAMLYVDLDHFKAINDRYGHAVGDRLLQEFTARVTSLVRPGDAVARLGGDEFVVVLTDVRQPQHARKVADKVLRAAREPFQLGDVALRCSASVGVACHGAPDEGWRDLLARADAKLYDAKAGGRDRQA